ncbi:hypothetical protein PENTCL1PPCAC_21643, partial [Pristionchus entomophagus]
IGRSDQPRRHFVSIAEIRITQIQFTVFASEMRLLWFPARYSLKIEDRSADVITTHNSVRIRPSVNT